MKKFEKEWLLTLSVSLLIYLSIMLRDVYCCRGEHARKQHPQLVPGEGDGLGGEGIEGVASHTVNLYLLHDRNTVH